MSNKNTSSNTTFNSKIEARVWMCFNFENGEYEYFSTVKNGSEFVPESDSLSVLKLTYLSWNSKAQYFDKETNKMLFKR